MCTWWHVSLCGRDRLQWSVSFAAVLGESGGDEAVARYIESFHEADNPYDCEAYLYFDDAWLHQNTPEIAARLVDLGLIGSPRSTP